MAVAGTAGIPIDEARALDMVQASLRAALAAAPWPRALANAATDALSDRTRVLGGRLTPWAMFPLSCCAAACGDWQRALPAAVAAELYAAASDLFDDLEDGDRAAVVERHGVPVSINLATALLALVHRVLDPGRVETRFATAARRAQDAFWDGCAVAAGGQHLDLAAAGSAPLSVEECLDIARRKGGALVDACCRAGAAFGTDDPELIAGFGRFGQALGLYAQLDNDMHDADGEAGKTDLQRRTQTVPIACARLGLSAAQSLDEVVWQGGIQLAYALMHAERARAEEHLEAVAAQCADPPQARAVLGALLRPRSPVPTG